MGLEAWVAQRYRIEYNPPRKSSESPLLLLLYSLLSKCNRDDSELHLPWNGPVLALERPEFEATGHALDQLAFFLGHWPPLASEGKE